MLARIRHTYVCTSPDQPAGSTPAAFHHPSPGPTAAESSLNSVIRCRVANSPPITPPRLSPPDMVQCLPRWGHGPRFGVLQRPREAGGSHRFRAGRCRGGSRTLAADGSCSGGRVPHPGPRGNHGDHRGAASERTPTCSTSVAGWADRQGHWPRWPGAG